MTYPYTDLMDLTPAERRAVEHGPVGLPAPLARHLPDGWRIGAHYSGSTWWASHDGGGVALVEERPDYDPEDMAGDELDELAEGVATYQIESRIPGSDDAEARQWSAYAVGMPGNRFPSREEAEAAIEDLRRLGDEWATAEYRVVEVR